MSQPDDSAPPAGKCAKDENFPVGSRLIHPRLRRHVACFYDFARTADDVADDPRLGAAEKLRRLDGFAAGLDGGRGPVEASRLRESLAASGVGDGHARDLLAAFRQDATTRRYPDWEALAGYCALSAAPVGRYLLDLHGEGRRARGPSDALCAALQVLNHLQDLREDYRRLHRVYLPTGWLAAEGADMAMLDADRASPALRRVIDRALDRCDDLLRSAAVLPRLVASKRLAAEAAVILRLAERLSRRLRREDPLAMPVRLSALDAASGAVRGLATLTGLARLRGIAAARPLGKGAA